MKNLNTNLGIIQRYKKDIPFSILLNRFIEKHFEYLFEKSNIQVLFVPNEPYFTEGETEKSAFIKMKKDIEENNCFQIWQGASENTIFGVPEINHKFRAIHDYYHFIHDLDFSAESELIVNYYQQKEFSFFGLPQLECKLLDIETGGQIVYFKKYGKFPEDQRKFCISELIDSFNYTKGDLNQQNEVFNYVYNP